MKRVVTAVVLLAGAGCLSPVDDRWCGPQQPCTQGFVCNSAFHCVAAPRVTDGGSDAGSGGGTGGGGGGGGGGSGGGGGIPVGGGLGGGGGGLDGGLCSSMSCASGCCLGNNCVPVLQQGNSVCGFFGDRCRTCALDEGCVGGKCEPSGVVIDGGRVTAVGGPCFSDFECSTDGLGFCIPEFSEGQSTGFIGGYCSRYCDNAPCPGNASCVQARSGGGVVNICLAACLGGTVCRMGYQCDNSVGMGVCLP